MNFDFLEFNLIVDGHITLVPPLLEDSEEVYSLIDESRLFLSEYLLWVEKTTSSYQTRSFLERSIKQMKQKELLLLKLTTQHRIRGLIGIQIDHCNQKGEIGYWIGRPFTKRGWVSASIQALIDYFFKGKFLHRFEIICAQSNINSQKIPQKLGFQLEGCLKGRALTARGFENAYMYGLVESV